MEPSPEETAKLLALRANVARSRLSAAVGELDRRRRSMLDVRAMVKEHSELLQLVAVGAVACATGIVAFAIYRVTTSGRRRPAERWRLLMRIWRHPELAARPEESFVRKIGRALVVAAARFLVARLLEESGPSAALEGPSRASPVGEPSV